MHELFVMNLEKVLILSHSSIQTPFEQIQPSSFLIREIKSQIAAPDRRRARVHKFPHWLHHHNKGLHGTPNHQGFNIQARMVFSLEPSTWALATRLGRCTLTWLGALKDAHRKLSKATPVRLGNLPMKSECVHTNSYPRSRGWRSSWRAHCARKLVG